MKLVRLILILSISMLIYSCDLGGSNGDLKADIDEDNIITSDNFTYSIDTITNNLQIPWGLTFLPNNDLLVTERSGEIRIIRDNELLDQKITGVPEVYAQGQGGLFEIKLHPDYESNGWLYISYAATGDGGGNTAIMRARLDGLNLVDKEIIFQALPFRSAGVHFGGHMEFDENGYLYLSTGDRGSRKNAQILSNQSGKIIRLKDDGSIPTDNPFVDDVNASPEVFTYGNRNPQGMAVHPVTGEIWTHEHGPMGGDEINIISPGLNFGWPEVTYGKNYDGTTISDITSRDDVAHPLHYWTPSIAPCGMEFVSSDRYPSWSGNLLVGSLKFRYVARIELDGEKVISEEKIIDNLGRIRSIVQGPDGLIYISMESPGMVVRLMPEMK